MELMAFVGAPSLIIGIFVLFGKIPTNQREMHKRMLEVTQAVAEARAKEVLAATAQDGIVLKDAPQVPANDDNDAVKLEADTPSPEEILEIEGNGMPAFVEIPETVAGVVAAEVIKADPHKVRERKARKRKAASPIA
jgi:hypothetical protein